MDTQEKIDLIAERISAMVGPIGRFVVEKQLHDMGATRETLPGERLRELMINSVSAAVYDGATREKLIRELTHELT